MLEEVIRAIIYAPLFGSIVDAVAQSQYGEVFIKPGPQLAPVANQRLMGNLKSVLPGTLVPTGHNQCGIRQPFRERLRVLWFTAGRNEIRETQPSAGIASFFSPYGVLVDLGQPNEYIAHALLHG